MVVIPNKNVQQGQKCPNKVVSNQAFHIFYLDESKTGPNWAYWTKLKNTCVNEKYKVNLCIYWVFLFKIIKLCWSKENQKVK
jgi:hypothetical protein